MDVAIIYKCIEQSLGKGPERSRSEHLDMRPLAKKHGEIEVIMSTES